MPSGGGMQEHDSPGPGGGAGSGGVSGSDVTTIVVYDGGYQQVIRSEGIEVVEVPGDLGQRQLTARGRDLLTRAHRTNSSENLGRNWNHRYRGQQEAFKFNLILQQTLALAAIVFNLLQPRDSVLKTQELNTSPTNNTVDPEDSEVALVYHINTQINFKEWLLMRDADIQWFNP